MNLEASCHGKFKEQMNSMVTNMAEKLRKSNLRSVNAERIKKGTNELSSI